jgi:DNA-binding transcriptional MerR regulator
MAEPAGRLWSIAELAREFAITPRTIRFYEDEGMLHPLRQGTRRLFRARDRVRLKLILRGRRLGFSLADIREIIDLYDADPGEAGQLDLFLRKIAERRAQLERQAEDIRVTLDEMAELEGRCSARLAELRGPAARAAG